MGSILALFRPSGPLCFPVRQRAFSASGGRAAAATGAAGGFYVSLCLIVQTAVQKMVENYWIVVIYRNLIHIQRYMLPGWNQEGCSPPSPFGNVDRYGSIWRIWYNVSQPGTKRQRHRQMHTDNETHTHIYIYEYIYNMNIYIIYDHIYIFIYIYEYIYIY